MLLLSINNMFTDNGKISDVTEQYPGLITFVFLVFLFMILFS